MTQFFNYVGMKGSMLVEDKIPYILAKGNLHLRFLCLSHPIAFLSLPSCCSFSFLPRAQPPHSCDPRITFEIPRFLYEPYLKHLFSLYRIRRIEKMLFSPLQLIDKSNMFVDCVTNFFFSSNGRFS